MDNLGEEYMKVEIPEELKHPTLEELEARTEADLARKWKPCKKPGKRERLAKKQEKEAAKLREIANEFDKTKQKNQNSLSNLFVKNEKAAFSLADVSKNKSANPETAARPTLRVSLGVPSLADIRKRGRPPRVNPL